MEREYNVRYLEEGDTKILFDVIERFIVPAMNKKDNSLIISESVAPLELSKRIIRKKLYNYENEFIGVFNGKCEMQAVLALRVEHNRRICADVCYFWAMDNKKVLLEYILEYIDEEFKKYFLKPVSKLALTVKQNTTDIDAWKEILQMCGFERSVLNSQQKEEEYIYNLNIQRTEV